jgi:integrase
MAKRKVATITDSRGRTRKATRRKFGKVELLPSGFYRARYVGPDGRTYAAPMTFTTETDADVWLGIQRGQIAAGTWTAPETKEQARAKAQAERANTLGQYAEAWIETRTNTKGVALTARTKAEYRRLLQTVLAPLSPLPLADLTQPKVREWYSAIERSGRATTASRAYQFLHAVMRTAVQERLAIENPVVVNGASNASTGRTSEPPTTAELSIIEASMPERLRLMVHISAWAGLRYGETTELRTKDITYDDDAVLIKVSRAVTHVTGQGFIVGKPKNAAGIRTVSLPGFAGEFREHIAKHAQPGPDGLLFPAPRGGHLAQSTFTDSWYPARAAAGRTDLTWHTLRAFAGTKYAHEGATLAEIQARLGHSTVEAAMKYQRVMAGRDAELAARMLGRR